MSLKHFTPLAPASATTSALALVKPLKRGVRAPDSMDEAIVSARFYAAKYGIVFYAYAGNSYMNLVYRVTMNRSEAFCVVGNSGGTVYAVTPAGEVSKATRLVD